MPTIEKTNPGALTVRYGATMRLGYQSGEEARVGVAGYEPVPGADYVALTVVRIGADGQTISDATAVMTPENAALLCQHLQDAVHAGNSGRKAH